MIVQAAEITDSPSRFPTTVRRALNQGTDALSRAGLETPWLDAELLLALVLGKRREDLYVQSETAVTEQQSQAYRSLLARRTLREPVAYIVGSREFWSLEFSVTQAVLIPRPETELLVEVSLKVFKAPVRREGSNFRVVDLGTGSGAIAVSLAKERSDWELWGTDLSAAAIEVAALNAVRHGVEARCRFFQGDLFAPVADKENFFNLVVSNPPYIRTDEIAALPEDVRDWEPEMALNGGVDGLDFYRRIVAQAPQYLTGGGLLLVEIEPNLEAQVRNLFAASGRYEDCVVHADYSGSSRVVAARKIFPGSE